MDVLSTQWAKIYYFTLTPTYSRARYYQEKEIGVPTNSCFPLIKDIILFQMSDWDRYAAEEYELLVAEESGNDHCDDV